MRAYVCDVCRHLVFFENTSCLACGATLGFVPNRRAVVALRGERDQLEMIANPGAGRWRRCPNAGIAGCNWLVPATAPAGDLCDSCRLTRTRPRDHDPAAMGAFAKAEAAKRRVVFQLRELQIPLVSRHEDAGSGLAFDLLSSATGPVTTGHRRGVVTLDLAESDDAYREATRVEMGEPYRTLLGHFRHEIGHYYWMVLVDGGPHLDAFRARFDDERINYQQALKKHYAQGPPDNWGRAHVSAYATMHPWEDWAETFAHYLHIRDTLQTASSYGVLITGPIDERNGRRDVELAAIPEAADLTEGKEGFSSIISEWLPFTYALNAVNRSMGRDDLYPFVLAPTVVDKLSFVHDLVVEARMAADAAVL
jgi:hypothetical protein